MRDIRMWTRAGLLLGASLLPATAWTAAAPDISGTYWAAEYHPKLQPVGGGEIPFTPAGKAAYEMNIAGLKDGSVVDIARKWCVPDGVPRVLATPYPFEIVQSPPGQILIMNELNHQIRAITMDKPLPSYQDLIAEPWYNGHGFGRWEGDTLVIQTRGFNDRTFMDATGLPHTDQLLTTERIRRLSPTQIEDVVTIHDPDYFTRDWSARFTYTLRNDVRLEDYLCGEEHRDISQVRGVTEARRARAQ
jgi:hypothetical protein